MGLGGMGSQSELESGGNRCFQLQTPLAQPHFYLPCTHCIIPESLLNHPNSFCEGMFKLNTKSDADSLLYLAILSVMATQYTCSLSGIYRPHWPVQWSRHCSRMCIPVHSPCLPGHTDVVQTILVIDNKGWTSSGQTLETHKWKCWA